jgi:hypothetical protein
MGTVNKTRDKVEKNSDPEVSEYLNKIKVMLDFLWKKLNDEKTRGTVEELEKYSRLFILWQKHYFTYKSLAPQGVKKDDVLSELIREKES